MLKTGQKILKVSSGEGPTYTAGNGIDISEGTTNSVISVKDVVYINTSKFSEFPWSKIEELFYAGKTLIVTNGSNVFTISGSSWGLQEKSFTFSRLSYAKTAETLRRDWYKVSSVSGWTNGNEETYLITENPVTETGSLGGSYQVTSRIATVNLLNALTQTDEDTRIYSAVFRSSSGAHQDITLKCKVYVEFYENYNTESTIQSQKFLVARINESNYNFQTDGIPLNFSWNQSQCGVNHFKKVRLSFEFDSDSGFGADGDTLIAKYQRETKLKTGA